MVTTTPFGPHNDPVGCFTGKKTPNSEILSNLSDTTYLKQLSGVSNLVFSLKPGRYSFSRKSTYFYSGDFREKSKHFPFLLSGNLESCR